MFVSFFVKTAVQHKERVAHFQVERVISPTEGIQAACAGWDVSWEGAAPVNKGAGRVAWQGLGVVLSAVACECLSGSLAKERHLELCVLLRSADELHAQLKHSGMTKAHCSRLHPPRSSV